MLQKAITEMIYLIFVQFMKHRMQITQEGWEYDLTTNSVNLMQQTTSVTSSLSEGDSSSTQCCTIFEIHNYSIKT